MHHGVFHKEFDQSFMLCLNHNHVLSDSQFRFSGKRSSVSLLLSAVNDWAETLNRHLSTCVFIDFAKLSIQYHMSIFYLTRVNCMEFGPLLQWFHEFLTSRHQRVVVNGHF